MQLSAQTEQNGGESPVGSARILLVPHNPASIEFDDAAHSFLVLDSDNRRSDAQNSSEQLEVLLQRVQEHYGGSSLVFLKVDSLLRGHVSSHLSVLTRHGPVVFAPALPALSRSTVGGVVRCDGVPLNETSLWSAEKETAPASIADALAPLATELVRLNTVRGNPAELDRILGELADDHTVAICDAETEEDLDIIAVAALRREGIQLAGASALGAAFCRALTFPLSRSGQHTDRPQPEFLYPAPNAEVVVADKSAQKPVLLVVGTASTESRAQLEALALSGVSVLPFTSAELLAGTADLTAVHTALAAGSVAVSISAGEVDPATSRRLISALARFIAPIAQRHPLVLTGGETARAVLNALGVHWLEPLVEIEHGAVLSRTDQDSLVVTRPGAFGGPDSLRIILEHFRSYLTAETATASRIAGKRHS
ncbi:MAG: four-carbon acid sugar kinase family protein [Lacisediminihabitans sp.]